MKKSLYNPNKPPLKVSWIYLHPFLFSNFLVTDFLQKWKLWCCCDPSVLKQMNWNQASMAHFGQYYYQLRSQDTLFGIEVPYWPGQGASIGRFVPTSTQTRTFHNFDVVSMSCCCYWPKIAKKGHFDHVYQPCNPRRDLFDFMCPTA